MLGRWLFVYLSGDVEITLWYTSVLKVLRICNCLEQFEIVSNRASVSSQCLKPDRNFLLHMFQAKQMSFICS